MTRTRSEYRLTDLNELPTSRSLTVRRPSLDQRAELAALLLDAYRDTIDDEDEDLDDALAAIDQDLDRLVAAHSFVAVEHERAVAMSFVVIVDDVHYIDPVAVATAHQRRGLGRDLVAASLHSLAAAGVATVGATITDGNVASERLFASFGFRRHGVWA